MRNFKAMIITTVLVLALCLSVPMAVQAKANFVPNGVIVMWAGPLSEIPVGWQLCDGTNETPNLLGVFVKGIPDDSEEPGITGGSISHDHFITYPTEQNDQLVSTFMASSYAANNPHDHDASFSDHLPPFYELAFICKVVEE